MRILVDAVDVVKAAYGPGGFHGEPVAGFQPASLLASHGLDAAQNAREVAVGGSDTTEDQLLVRIRQVGATVIWDRWRMVVIGRVIKEGPEVGLNSYRFD